MYRQKAIIRIIDLCAGMVQKYTADDAIATLTRSKKHYSVYYHRYCIVITCWLVLASLLSPPCVFQLPVWYHPNWQPVSEKCAKIILLHGT